MDVVYPLGKQTKWDHNEIRYSIRSLYKYCSDDIGNIHVIGEKPHFLDYSKVTHHSFTPDSRLAKELRIWEKILYACRIEDLSEEFFFMNDDYFFLSEFSIKNYPYYYNKDLKDFPWSGKHLSEIPRGYDRKSQRTLTELTKAGLPTLMFDIHRPNKVNKSKFREAYTKMRKSIRLDEYHGNGSMLINTTYCNFNKFEGTQVEDLKINNQDFSSLRDAEIFSIGDNAYGKNLEYELSSRFPERSPVELVDSMKRKSRKLKVKIECRFTDTKSGQLYTPGVFAFFPEDYKRLLKEGRKCTLLTPYEEPMVTNGAENKSPSDVTPEPKKYDPVLPLDFPFRDELVKAGFETLKSFDVDDIEKKLKDLKLTKAKIMKIALALEVEKKKYE